jgi:hypothetical protein
VSQDAASGRTPTTLREVLLVVEVQAETYPTYRAIARWIEQDLTGSLYGGDGNKRMDLVIRIAAAVYC